MQTLLLDIWEGSGKTVLFDTHDIDEEIYLADRILIMSAGPGTIKAEYPVTAPRPRGEKFLLSKEFLDLKRRTAGGRDRPELPDARRAAADVLGDPRGDPGRLRVDAEPLRTELHDPALHPQPVGMGSVNVDVQVDPNTLFSFRRDSFRHREKSSGGR